MLEVRATERAPHGAKSGVAAESVEGHLVKRAEGGTCQGLERVLYFRKKWSGAQGRNESKEPDCDVPHWLLSLPFRLVFYEVRVAL